MNVAIRRALVQFSLFGAFFLGILIGNLRAITSENIGRWFVVGLATALCSTLAINAAWWIRLNTTGGRPLALAGSTFVSAIIGTVFAMTQLLTVRLLDLTPERGELIATVSSIVSITLVGMALQAFIARRQRQAEQRIRLLEEGIAVALARQDVADLARRMQTALGIEIDDALAPARRRIEERLADQELRVSQDDWASVAQELRTVAQDSVRPLSKQLWSNTAGRVTPIRAGVVLHNIITQQPFRPVILSLILIVTALATSLMLYGWLLGIATIALGVALIFIVLGSANAAMKRWPAHHAAIFVIGSLTLQLGALINFPLRQWQQVQPYSWTEAIAAAVIGLILIVLTSGAGSLRTYQEDAAMNFQADIDREAIESIAAGRHVAQLARESARVLHGSVQTRLIACAVAIEQASEVKDVEAFRGALHEAHAALTKLPRSDESLTVPLVDEVAGNVALWEGLCGIDVDVDESLRLITGRQARDVGRIVQEGVSNAIRHGGASAVRVRVMDHEGAVMVVVEDNGRGPGSGRPGLGSTLLDSFCESWKLTALSPGARLVAYLA